MAAARASSGRGKRPQTFPEYRDDPNGFIVNVLGDIPWSKQREINRDVAEHQYVAVAACTGPGKTWDLARLVIWWLLTREDSIVVTTATTWTQVRTQLWREIADAKKDSRIALPGTLLQTEWNLGPKWFAIGLSARVPEAIAGFHARAKMDIDRLLRDDNPDGFEIPADVMEYLTEVQASASAVMVLVDEGSGVEDPLWEAFDGLLTNPGSRMVASGNPTKLSGRFHQIFHPPRGLSAGGDEWPWHIHHIAATDAPEEVIGRAWIDRMRVECGPNPERNPRYQVRVLGQFPATSDRYLYPLSLLERASEGASDAAPKGRHLGFDVARHGGDKCVAVLLVDGRVRGVSSWIVPEHHGNNLVVTSRRLLTLLKKWEVEPRNVHIDCTGGWGWGPHDTLHDWGYPVDGVDFGGGQLDDWRFVLGHAPKLRTRRQELHWILLRCLQERFVSIPDPKDLPQYGPIWTDLTEIIYDFKAREDFWVESKQEYRDRAGRSPDFSDALLCALSRRDPARVTFSTL